MQLTTRISLLPLALALVGFVLLAVAGPAYRVGLSLDAAYGVMRWGAYVGGAGILAGLIIAALAYREATRSAEPGGAAAEAAVRWPWFRLQKTHLQAALAILGVVAGLTAVIIPYSWQRRIRTSPPLQDVTTDLDNPPAFVAVVPLRADSENTLDRVPLLATLQRDGYPDLAPVTMSLPPDRVFNRALDVIERLGWGLVGSDQAAGRIEATDTSTWFGFKDDVVVRVTPWGTGARVDVRSVSRVRRNDGGEGARRIHEFLRALQAE